MEYSPLAFLASLIGRKQTNFAHKNALDALTRAAEEAIKNRNPRGPR